MYAIELTELTKKFKNRTAVDSLSFQINEGEIFSLLGQNGAGKTTTIRMLSCLCSPTSGDAKVMGRSILSNEEDVKHLIGVSPQETARSTQAFRAGKSRTDGFRIRSCRAESRRRADEMMAAFGLSDRSATALISCRAGCSVGCPSLWRSSPGQRFCFWTSPL